MKAAIVGCGLIGQKRATAALANGIEIVSVVDTDAKQAEKLAASTGAAAGQDWRDVIGLPSLDIVFIATSHDYLAEIAIQSLLLGKHVLIEKPGGRNLADVRRIREAAQASGLIVKVGYNHRFHPALIKARELIDEGVAGPLMFIRGRYGHGGRPGYDQEWRFHRDISGGGQLIDQGSHLVDLAHWFLGDLTLASSETRRFFWSGDVEDNVFLTLSASGGQIAWLHATWTEWKNMFSFEIYGQDAKLDISGLGGSYGVESCTLYKMLPGMGPPETTRWEWPFPDRSWEAETAEFISAIRNQRRPCGDIDDAFATMTVIDAAYGGLKDVADGAAEPTNRSRA